MSKMLTKPEYGWTNFEIEDYTYGLGYLTDVALDWLDEAIHGLTEIAPFTVRGFCEPGRMLCTVSYWDCYILMEDEDGRGMYDFHAVKMSMIDFCKQLHQDISKDIDAWVRWDVSGLDESYCATECNIENCNNGVSCIMDEEDFMNPLFEWRKKKIQDKLNILKELIKKSEEHFGPNRGFF